MSLTSRQGAGGKRGRFEIGSFIRDIPYPDPSGNALKPSDVASICPIEGDYPARRGICVKEEYNNENQKTIHARLQVFYGPARNLIPLRNQRNCRAKRLWKEQYCRCHQMVHGGAEPQTTERATNGRRDILRRWQL